MPKQNPQEADAIAPGTVIDGRYKVVRPIGQGGNGAVYEVEHTRTGRKLALKALLEEAGFARLEQEARAASMMKNGHTARIIDMEAGGPTGAYMVMELLDGQSLRALLDDAGQLPLELTVNMAMQVCECLHEAHGLGIIHRDLKPENIFLCPSPWPGQHDVKVLDFGVMKIADGGSAIPKSSLTRTGSTVGTPYYMSLEQLRNSSAVDARADVYSLGVLLYECLSGRKPFQADTIGDLVYALCSGPPTQLARLRPDLPADVTDLVMRTLSANRDDRPARMLDVALALLSHVNPAFALWVKVDGKQPALARPPAPSLSDVAPRPTTARIPAPTLTLDPQRPPPPKAMPAAGRPAPQREPPREERRDTPTEMYVKGVHGTDGFAPGESGEGESGDRDTPTRAISLDAIQRTPMPGPSPSAMDTGAEPGDIATLDLREGALLVPRAPDAPSFGQPPPPATDAPRPAVLQPGAAEAKMTMPLAAFLANAPPSSQGAPPPGLSFGAPPLSARQKPAWQEKLDRWLITVGRASEQQLLRYRRAPQNTQIIVVIVAGTVAILVIGLVLFVALHRG
jgi:eukaryotic-like serine/threonine-protein kinase